MRSTRATSRPNSRRQMAATPVVSAPAENVSTNVIPTRKNGDVAGRRRAAVGRRIQHLDDVCGKGGLGENLLEIVDEMRAAKASNPIDLCGARRFEPDARLVEAEPGGVEEPVTAHPLE